MFLSEKCVGRSSEEWQRLVQFCVPPWIPAKELAVLLTIDLTPSSVNVNRVHILLLL